jgi:hypothetical protein
MFSGFELGSIYLEEIECKDLEKAKTYLGMSANAGNPKSIRKLKLLSGDTVNLQKKSRWKFWK